MADDTTQIETGTESDDRADADAANVSPDVWGYADDGEHATTWAVERVDETTIRVETHRHEAGLDDVDAIEEFRADAGVSTEEHARRIADADPEQAVRLARKHFEANTS